MGTTTDGRPIKGAHGRTVYDDELGRARCTADSKQAGRRCKSRPIPGGAVCRLHGGAAPQTVKSARRRLLELVDPSIVALAEILEGDTAEWQCLEEGVAPTSESAGRPGVWKQVGYAPEVKLRAAEAILDRTGHPRRQELDLGDARGRLLERLRAQTEQADT